MAMNFSSSDFLPTLDSLCCLEGDMRKVLSVEHLQFFNCCSGEVGTERAPWILKSSGRVRRVQSVNLWIPKLGSRTHLWMPLALLRWGGLVQEGGFYKKPTSVQLPWDMQQRHWKAGPKLRMTGPDTQRFFLVLWTPPHRLGSLWGKRSSFLSVLLLADRNTDFWHFGGRACPCAMSTSIYGNWHLSHINKDWASWICSFLVPAAVPVSCLPFAVQNSAAAGLGCHRDQWQLFMRAGKQHEPLGWHIACYWEADLSPGCF